MAQFPGCPAIDAGVDQTLPCSQNCTDLTATPFHTGLTNTYAVSSIPHTPPIAYNAGGGNPIAVGVDDVWSPIINLPFNFCYYGQNYSTVKVGANGAIQFNPAAGGGGHPWSFNASCPSTALNAAGHIFGAYHDIDPGVGGNIQWYLLGTAPCRIFVVSFNAVPHYSCNNLTTTQMIVLYETTNAIDVYIQNKPTCGNWNNGNAVVGIQNPAGTQGVAAPGRNTSDALWAVNTPEGWRFTPNGAPNYTVNWYEGATLIGSGNTVNVCPSSTTTYTAQITYDRCDGTQVVESDNVIVNYSNLDPAVVTPNAETCENHNDGSVTIDNPVGAGPYTVTINGPTTSTLVEPNTAGGQAIFTNLPDGAYTYTATGANGCTSNGNFTINAGPPCCDVTAVSTDVDCNGGNSGTATASPTGTAPYSYVWSNAQTGQVATGLVAGAYSVTLTDAYGCTATANVNVTEPTDLIANAVETPVTCNGGCDGTVTINASNGTGPYTYSLNGATYQGSNTFTGLCAGNGIVTVQDANGCLEVVNYSINQPTVVSVVTNSPTPATCGANNGSIVLVGSGGIAPYTYSIGGSAQGTGSFINLAAGNYTGTVTDANGCSATVNFVITSESEPTASLLSSSNITCFGGLDGSVLIGVSGGTLPFQYSLNGGPNQASNAFGGLAAGSYTVTVTDAIGCQSDVTFTITSPPQLSYNTVVTDASCFDVCDGAINVNVSGGVAPYSYSLNNGVTYGTANPITSLCAGSVNLIVQDANGCLANSFEIINEPTQISATFANTDPICQGACNGTSTVSAAGGTPTYSYSLNGGPFQASNVVSGLCGGNNDIIIQDANGCQETSTVTLIDPPSYNITTVTMVESNCNFNNGAITVSADGTDGPFTFTLNGGPATSPGNDATFTDLLAGAYSIVATDQNGCQAQGFVGINDVEMDGILLDVVNASCYNGTDGSVEVTNVSGAMPITYELDNSGTTQTSGIFTGLSNGSHVVTIYDAGFCIFTLPFNVSEPTEIQFQSSSVDVACNGGSTGEINFTSVSGGTPGYEYSIDGGFTFNNSPNFNGLAAGMYNLVVRDTNGCMVSGSATVNEATPVVIDFSSEDLTCFGNNTGYIQISGEGGQGGYTYSIDNGASFSSNTLFVGLAAGNYDLVVQDVANCQTTAVAVVSEPPLLTSVSVTNDPLCFNSCDGSIVFNANGGTLPYQYSVDNGVTFDSSATVGNICAGNHTLIVQDANNCSTSEVVVINQPANLTMSSTLTNETCSAGNGEIVITANGGTLPYSYSNDNGATTQAASSFNGLSANNYQLVVTDANNCLISSSEQINNEASPIIVNTTITNVSCNALCDGSVDVLANGGTGALSYELNGLPAQPTSLIQGLCAGNYTLTITDANGCTDSDPILITEPTPLTFNSVINPVACFGENTGGIIVNANGGTIPYLYSTDGGVQQTLFNNLEFLSAGNYNVHVEDANGCVVTSTETVTEPNEFTIDNEIVVDASCYSFCDGELTVQTAGGSGAPTYEWVGGTIGGNSPTVNGLCAGSYDVLVTDANGCTATSIMTVNEPPLLSITSTSFTNTSCNAVCDGTISIIAPNAVEFSVDGGITYQSGSTFNGLCAGTYTIEVRDANGCTQQNQLTISEPDPLVEMTIPEDGMIICHDGYGTLSGDANGGTAPYYFVWNTGDTTQFLNVNLTDPETFDYFVVDINGCISGTQQANVDVHPDFIPEVTSTITICPGEIATALASGSGGVPGYEYQWLTNENDTLGFGDTYIYTPEGIDTILLVANDECYQHDTLEVTIEYHSIQSPQITPTDAEGCSPLNVTFENTLGNAYVAETIWSFEDGTIMNGNSIDHEFTTVGCHNVFVQVTSVDGCITDSTFSSVACVHPDPVAQFYYSPNQPTTISNLVSFQNASEGAETYSWTFDTYGNSSEENPELSFNGVGVEEVEVCLTAISEHGCVHDTCKPIEFVEEFVVHIPNTFTPDYDQYNQNFVPVFPSDVLISEYKMLIFNRWGEIVFESQDPAIGWNGKYANFDAQDGTYVWKIELKAGPEKERVLLKGHVNLIK